MRVPARAVCHMTTLREIDVNGCPSLAQMMMMMMMMFLYSAAAVSSSQQQTPGLTLSLSLFLGRSDTFSPL